MAYSSGTIQRACRAHHLNSPSLRDQNATSARGRARALGAKRLAQLTDPTPDSAEGFIPCRKDGDRRQARGVTGAVSWRVSAGYSTITTARMAPVRCGASSTGRTLRWRPDGATPGCEGGPGRPGAAPPPPNDRLGPGHRTWSSSTFAPSNRTCCGWPASPVWPPGQDSPRSRS
jgi:hypothetical protein